MFKLEIEPSEVLHTEFGNAKLNNIGYYIITSRKENNNGKLLHRLIWEKWYGTLPPTTYIHHLDENRTNNCIWNLEPLHNSDHTSLHHKGLVHSKETCIKMSNVRNTTGYLKVSNTKRIALTSPDKSEPSLLIPCPQQQKQASLAVIIAIL